jgi:DNA-binding XRE family transcriptional regulator
VNIAYSKTASTTMAGCSTAPGLMPKSVFSDAYARFLEVLIAARKEARVTQAELARRLGREQPFISLIERGVRRVDVVEFFAIARALGVDPVALVERIGRALPDKISV